MALFAVQYTYADEPARLDHHRPAHREFLRALADEGTLVAAGPMNGGGDHLPGAAAESECGEAGFAGALVLVDAPDATAVASLLDADPFAREGLIIGRAIRPWTITVGGIGVDD